MSTETTKEREMSNRALIPSRRQLFEGPTSDDLDFRSIPLLLQEVGNWMESQSVEDPEFDSLVIERTFPNPESDECRYTASLYYRKESDIGSSGVAGPQAEEEG